MKICKVEGCERKYWAREMCPKHYARWRTRNGNINDPIKKRSLCNKEGCFGVVAGIGLCTKHYHIYTCQKKLEIKEDIIKKLKRDNISLSELIRPTILERKEIFWNWYKSLSAEQRSDHYSGDSDARYYNEEMSKLIWMDEVYEVLKISSSMEERIRIDAGFPPDEFIKMSKENS